MTQAFVEAAATSAVVFVVFFGPLLFGPWWK